MFRPRFFALGLALGVLFGCAAIPASGPTAMQSTLDEDVQVQMTPRQQALCEEEGGCTMWSQAALNQLINIARMRALESCGKDI